MKASHSLRAASNLFKPKHSIQLDKLKFAVLPPELRNACETIVQKVAQQHICPIKDFAITHRHKTELIYSISDYITRDLNLEKKERHATGGLNTVRESISNLSYQHSLVFTLARTLDNFNYLNADTSIREIKKNIEQLKDTFGFTFQEKVRENKKLLKEQAIPTFNELFHIAKKYPALQNCITHNKKELDSLNSDLSEAIKKEKQQNLGLDLD
jgi:hypothetical protein